MRQDLAGWGWILGGSQGQVAEAVGPALTESYFSSVPPVDSRVGFWWKLAFQGWLQLSFVCMLCFLFLKTVACTSLFPSLCGDWRIKSLLRETWWLLRYSACWPNNSFMSLFCDFFFPTVWSFRYSFCGFVPLVIQDFLRVYLESFAFLFSSLTIWTFNFGKVTQKILCLGNGSA